MWPDMSPLRVPTLRTLGLLHRGQICISRYSPLFSSSSKASINSEKSGLSISSSLRTRICFCFFFFFFSSIDWGFHDVFTKEFLVRQKIGLMVHFSTLVHSFTNIHKSLKTNILMEFARLKRRQVISVSLTAVILSFSFLTLASSLSGSVFPLSTLGDDRSRFVIPAPLILGAVFHDNLARLNQSTRVEIYGFVKNHPGMQFRGICYSLNLPIGVVQYHLWSSHKGWFGLCLSWRAVHTVFRV